jgi:hypothetical protein
MSFLLRLFPVGHLVISVLFLLAGAALIALAAVQLSKHEDRNVEKSAKGEAKP